MAKLTSSYFEENFLYVDKAIVRKGEVTLYRGFFYGSAEDQERFEQSVIDQLEKSGIKVRNFGGGYICDRPFKGGAPVNKQNHYWVRFYIQ